MQVLKKLAGQTAIYGLPSIIGRLLNYLLVPLHTGIFVPERFGVITEMYSYVAFLVVLLTYGMETAYFRFQSKTEENAPIFSTVLLSLLSTTLLFIAICSLFAQDIADFIAYSDHKEYVVWFAFIVGMDAVSSIPLARLRLENKAKKFALINMSAILINIGLNLFWIGYCIPENTAGNSNFILDHFYDPSIGVGYVFLANLFASFFKFLLLSPIIFKVRMRFDWEILKQMLKYASPLLVASLAIIVNESADKIMLKWMLKDDLGVDGATKEVGIYGACYKLSIIISLFIQAFRYAAEPFFFSQEKHKDAKETYANIMKYFVIVCAVIFLGVMLYLDWLRYFIPNQSYWVGLKVVPILLFANIFLGIFYNQSIWYKLSEKTGYGALIASIGALITIALNLLLIPTYQYLGSAWATFFCYLSMVLLSFYYGNKHYAIPYSIKRIVFYLVFAFLLYLLSEWISSTLGLNLKFIVNSFILLGFLSLVYVLEKPKKAIIS